MAKPLSSFTEAEIREQNRIRASENPKPAADEHDGWIDSCNYENVEGFSISYDGESGLWYCYDPDGEFIETKSDCREAMIAIG